MTYEEIRITKDDQEGFCRPESLSTWEDHGWTRADDGDSEEEAPATPEPAQADEAEEV